MTDLGWITDDEEEAESLEYEIDIDIDIAICRVCGCTENDPCPRWEERTEEQLIEKANDDGRLF